MARAKNHAMRGIDSIVHALKPICACFRCGKTATIRDRDVADDCCREKLRNVLSRRRLVRRLSQH